MRGDALGRHAETTNHQRNMKMREQIQHLEEQVASIREAFAELWGSISLYLSQEQIESLKTYHAEEFAELEEDEE